MTPRRRTVTFEPGPIAARSSSVRRATQRCDPSLRTLDYVVAALRNLGGAHRSVDIEDIAMEAYRLAPHRFRWRRYPEQVDIAGARDGLSDARKRENGGLVVGDRKHGWTLTAEGVAHASRIGGTLSPEHIDGSAQADLRLDVPVRAAERQRVESSTALRKVRAGQRSEVTPQEVRELLRVDRYVTQQKYKQRVAIVLNALRDDPELVAIVQDLERGYREGAEAT
jgi:hypothetical protein